MTRLEDIKKRVAQCKANGYSEYVEAIGLQDMEFLIAVMDALLPISEHQSDRWPIDRWDRPEQADELFNALAKLEKKV